MEVYDELERVLKELDKFRPFTSAYEMKKEIEKLNNIIKEAREKVHDIYFRIDNIPQNHWIGIKLDTTNQGQELLEILDKETKNENI